LNGVEGSAVGFFEEKQVAAFVHDADSDFNGLALRLVLSGGDHGLDGGQVQVFLAGEVGGGRG